MPQFLKDTSDWCVDGALTDHKIIRKFAVTTKTTSYLAKNKKGDRVTLTYIDNDRIIEKYGLAAYAQGGTTREAEEVGRKKIEQFKGECLRIVEKTKGLAHEHVAETYDMGFDREKDQSVIISEYVPGLDIYLGTRGYKPLQLVSIFLQAFLGLNFIHQNRLLHLNLKPTKIRIDHEGIPPVVKITDFGLAIPFEGYDGEYFSTPAYESPEVVLRAKDKIGERSDLYSMAAVMYYCLTGHVPFEDRLRDKLDREGLKKLVEKEPSAAPPSQYDHNVPKELDDVIVKLLRPNPDDRKFKNALDVISEFEKTWPEESHEMPLETVTTLTQQ